MQDGQKVFKIIGAAAAIAVIVLIYNLISIQSTAAKIEARDLVLLGLGAKSKTQATPTQPATEPAEITVVLITDATQKSLVSLSSLVLQLKQMPELKIIAEKKFEKDSGEAKQLIEKYKIGRIPVVLLQGEAKKSAVLSQNWPKLGTIESDGTMVFRNIPPIYLEIGTGKLRGETKAVYVSVPDKNEVFDANVFRQILQTAFGVNPIEEETISHDSPEGKAIVSKYGVEKVPTAIISGDLNAYTGFPETWKQGGSIEPDNSFVFRALDAIRGVKYLDLNKNEVVETPQQGQ